MFSHDVAGRFFLTLEDARSQNTDNPEADLYSILNQIEKYRKNGVFHVRLCIPELASQYDFPCNEWTQSSNFAESYNVNDFKAIELTLKGGSEDFAGLALKPPTTFVHTLIAMVPGHYWFAIGCQWGYWWGIYGIGSPHTDIAKIELFLAVGKVIR